jgi:hypothetical protein
MSFKVQRDIYSDLVKTIDMKSNTTTTDSLDVEQLIIPAAAVGGVTIPATCAGFITVDVKGKPYLLPIFNVAP